MINFQIHTLIFILLLALIMTFLFLKKEKSKKSLSKLAIFSFLFIIAGVTFGEYGPMGDGLVSVGLVFAIGDIIKKGKQKKKTHKSKQ